MIKLKKILSYEVHGNFSRLMNKASSKHQITACEYLKLKRELQEKEGISYVDKIKITIIFANGTRRDFFVDSKDFERTVNFKVARSFYERIKYEIFMKCKDSFPIRKHRNFKVQISFVIVEVK